MEWNGTIFYVIVSLPFSVSVGFLFINSTMRGAASWQKEENWEQYLQVKRTTVGKSLFLTAKS